MTCRYYFLTRQQGQAMAETLVLLLVLAVLWFAIAWLGRLQDTALQLQHGSRYIAFSASRANSLIPPVNGNFMALQSKQWINQHGQELWKSDYASPIINLIRGRSLSDNKQIASGHPHAATLRKDWETNDPGLITARLELLPKEKKELGKEASLFKLHELTLADPLIKRQLSIASQSGHASSDRQTVRRIEQSDLAWQQAARSSQGLAQLVERGVRDIDRAWKRPELNRDWLQQWEKEVPGQYLIPEH